MLYQKISSLIKSGRLVEIGFGDAYLLNKLSKKYECCGADISKENVEQMRKNIKSIEFDIIDTNGRLPYKDNFFNGFIASEVFEHMSDKELRVAVGEMKRILKSDGFAILTFPAEERLKEAICYCPNCGKVFHRWGHKQSWNDNKIKKLFKGFKIITVKKFFTIYRGSCFKERIIGFMMYALRNIADKFIDVPNKTYLVILKK